MRRKKCRPAFSFHGKCIVEVTMNLWICLVYFYFIALCACNDSAGTTSSSTYNSQTPVYSPSSSESQTADNFTNAEYNTIDAINNYTSTKSEQHKQTFVRSGNELWDSLIDECLQKPTFSCFQKNVYTYLDNTLKLNDVNVTDRIIFKKIDIDPITLLQLQNETEEENEILKEESRVFESESPIEEVTDALYGKWRNFMMTHNVELKMPDMLFDGATFRITPRAFEGDGALIKLEMIPKSLEEARTGGRFLLKKISKLLLKKFFKHKLLLSFLAIVLFIKLIKIKIFWILPLIVGVAAAKKLLLKFILFLFPALSHLFKLCSYYHKNYHDTKYHHHHHQINHLHTVVPAWYKDINDHHGHPPVHGNEVIYTSPPKGHPAEYIHSLPNPHQHYPTNWEHSGPGLGSEYISGIHRNIDVNSFKPKLDDSDTINSWGLADSQPLPKPNDGVNGYADSHISASSYPAPAIENSIGRTPYADTKPSQASIYNSYAPSSQMKNSHENKYGIAEKIQNAIRQQPAFAPTQALMMADPFYGPIVAKIDSILQQYGGFLDDNCKEWLICNMYKDPTKYSPYSNFLSAELSRDSTELQKPATMNAAVLTFYKYVKAARDGQDQKNCLSLNTKCIL